MGFVVAFSALDGAIFGLNSSSAPGNNAPVTDSEDGGADVLSRDVFDEGSSEDSAPLQSGANGSATSTTPPERSVTLSEEERRLMAINNFSWDSIAEEHIAASQNIIEKFDQQNFTRQKPAQPGAEPLLLPDRVSVDVNRGRDIDREEDLSSLDGIIDIETPIDIPMVGNELEEEPPDNSGQQEDDEEDPSSNEGESGDDSSGSGSGEEEDDDQSGESGDQGDSGSGSNSTGTNSTSTGGSSEDSGSGGGGNDTSNDDLGTEASISLG